VVLHGFDDATACEVTELLGECMQVERVAVTAEEEEEVFGRACDCVSEFIEEVDDLDLLADLFGYIWSSKQVRSLRCVLMTTMSHLVRLSVCW
jgi:hypothetical protein